MVEVLLLGPARQVAGTGRCNVEADTVAAVIAALTARFGDGFADVLDTARIWVDGQPAGPDEPVPSGAEVSVLPPVSGG